MTNLLIRLFIKDYQNTEDENVRTSYGKFSSVVGLVTNLLLTITKIAMGLLVSSISIIADGVNNLADSLTSILILIAFFLASKPADKEHPYGHQRFEYIAGLFISVLIFLSGLSLTKVSIEKIITPNDVKYSSLTLILLIVSILVKFWQSIFYRKVSKMIDSKTIYTNSVDSLNDSLSTLSILISMLILRFFNLNLDAYLGLILSLFVIYSSISLMNDTISPLLGEAPDSKYLQSITDHLDSYSGYLSYHDILVHNYGPLKRFVTVHVEVDSQLSLVDAHDLIDQIEVDFKSKGLGDLLIHLDPIDINCPQMNELHSIIKETINDYNSNLSFQDLRRGTGVRKNQIFFDIVIPSNEKVNYKKLEKNIQQVVCKYNSSLEVIITKKKEFV